MRYVFFGTPRFAELVLKRLIDSGFPPEMVICNPDRPVGRDQVVTPPPTKKLAKENDIPVYQPEELDYEEFKSEMPDDIRVGVLAAYGKIIPKEIIDFFTKGIVGVHPSLLPEYRGPTPIRSAVLNGEVKTGVTLFLMDEKVDHGPLIVKEPYDLSAPDMYEDLRDKLAKLGGNMVVEYLPKYLEGKITPNRQNHDAASFTSFFESEDGRIDYDDLSEAIDGDIKKAIDIDRKIKALNPEPSVWTKTGDKQILSLPKNKRVKLLESHIEDDKLVLDKIHVAGKPEPRKP